ncbi:MAG: Ig-like domain-containing protein [Prevotellaceae bacterium]|jgi:uncharacterized protein (TIGR02145 family)|nr:Ig-like domain-containing protein [Prevotellaceae bacterium]
MKTLKTISFGLLLTVGLATVVFNSCKSDEPEKETPLPIDPKIPETPSISLDTASLALTIGENYTLTATILPANSINETVTWTSSDGTKATVTNNGKVTAIAEGNTTITATAGDKTVTCTVKVRNGIKINGVVWAKYNVDNPNTFAVTPESAGKFYQWNRITAWSTEGNTMENFPYFNEGGGEWKKNNDPSPAGWRIPTRRELEKLSDSVKVIFEQTTQNSVTGCLITDKINNNSIFLPYAGYRTNIGKLYGSRATGCYWSSTADYNNTAYRLGIGSYSIIVDDWNQFHSYGYSVRCVAE